MSNNMSNQAMFDAQLAESKKQWGVAARHYTQAIGLVDQRAGIPYVEGRSQLPEPAKDQALECWIGHLRCRLALHSLGEDAYLFDIGHRAVREIKRTEREIHTYRTRYPIKLWNTLHEAYNSLEDEYRQKDMPRAADILYCYSMRARKNLFFWLAVKGRGGERARLGGKSKRERIRERVRFAWQFLSLLITQIITGFGSSPWRPVMILVPIPILLCALAYWLSQGLVLNGNPVPVTEPHNFLYNLCFSIFTFTGAGPGDLTPHGMWVELLAAVEVVVGYMITVVALGYLFNQLSSRSAYGTRTKRPEPREGNSG